MLKTIVKARGAEGLIVVSDSSPFSGMPPGKYRSTCAEVILEESGRLYEPKSGYLAGSSSNMLSCMNVLASLDLLILDELLKTGFYNHPRLIGVDPQTLSTGTSVDFDRDKNLFSVV